MGARAKPKRLTCERLKEALHYDPDTGIFRWKVQTSPRVKIGAVTGYRQADGQKIIILDGERHCAHRLAVLYMTGRWPVYLVDHKNMDRSDNRWANLREATKQQNCANKGPQRNNRLGYKGVTQVPSGRFRAEITVDGKGRCIGTFDTPHEASAAYLSEARKVFGEFARTE